MPVPGRLGSDDDCFAESAHLNRSSAVRKVARLTSAATPWEAMRAATAIVAIAVVTAASPTASAEPPVVVSGSFGAGMVGTRPVSIAAAELDLERDSFSLGLGAELRFDGDRLLEGDWDELRDGAGLLRHLLWQPRGSSIDVAASVAVGRLGAITAGSGAAVDGVSAGVDLDRQRLGAELKVATLASRVHAWVDDLIDPEIGSLRVAGELAGPVEVGATVAGDRGRVDGPRGSIGVEAAIAGRRGGVAGRVYADAVRLVRESSGVHVGARGEIGGERSRVGLRVEGHAGTRGYVAGWLGPLYVRDRLIAGAGSMSTRRTGGLVEIDGAHDGVGAVRLRLERRAGRGPGARLELRISRLRAIQAGAWAAVVGDESAFGAELRIRFPKSLFSRLEARRQYTTAAEMPAAVWSVGLTFGASLGD